VAAQEREGRSRAKISTAPNFPPSVGTKNEQRETDDLMGLGSDIRGAEIIFAVSPDKKDLRGSLF
jgi:hypothetical protein